MEQLKELGCELSLQSLRSYAAKNLIPKAVREGGGRGAESVWHPETIPEAVAASELLTHQRMNFTRVAQIRKMGRYIEKMLTADDFEKTLFQDSRVRKFVAGDQLTAFRLGVWLKLKWRAVEQLYSVLTSWRQDPGIREPEIFRQIQATEKFLIQGYLTSGLMDIANKETEPVIGKLVDAGRDDSAS